MTRDEVRAALLDEDQALKEVRTNDGRVFLVRGKEYWALGTDRLVVLVGPANNTIAIRNIASIGPGRSRRPTRRGR